MLVTWTLRGCAILFALAMFVGTWSGAKVNHQFSDHGQRAVAEPLDRYMETTTVKKKLGITVSETTSKSAEVFFTTADHQRIKVNRHLPDKEFARFSAGEPVYIEYLPEEPGSVRFMGHSESPWLCGLLGVIALIIAKVFWRKM
jgi:hypothetical protein